MRVLIFLCFCCVFSFTFSQRKEGERFHAKNGYPYYWGRHQKLSRKDIFKIVDSNLNYNDYWQKNYDVFCQYSILDGDTIDYIDAKGQRQGLFIFYCSYKGIYGFADCGLDEFSKCKKCAFEESQVYYRNDSIIKSMVIGYYRNRKTDTLSIEIYEYENNRKLKRYRDEDKGYYWIGYKDLRWGYRQGMVETFDSKTHKLIEKAYYVDNNYKDSVFHFHENGVLQALGIYKNEEKKIFYRFFRDNGVKYSEVEINNYKITSKICFDEKGKKKIPCDSTKTLYGTPKGTLVIVPNGQVGIIK